MGKQAIEEKGKRTTINAWGYYREKGFSVFPVNQNKKPVVKWGQYRTRRATDAEIAEWKKRGFNIAIATGVLSDLMVVDADSVEAVEELQKLNRDGIKVPTVHSPRSGRRHFYVRYHESLWKNLRYCGKSGKIDFKTEGGFVLAPPGRTKDGTYEWDSELDLDTTSIPIIPKRWNYLLLHARLSSTTGVQIEESPRLVEGGRDVDIFGMACDMRKRGWPRKDVEEMAVAMAVIARRKPHTHDFTNQDALDKVKSAWSRPLRDKFRGTEEVDSSIPMTYKMSDIPEERVPWLWKNYIPSEALTLINGDPDAGKSWWALDLASRVTKGEAWPDGERGDPAANVYYMTYEDVLSQQIKRRIRTIGADQNRFYAFNSEYPLNLLLSEEEGRNMLEAELTRIGDVRLLIIDPILDFTGTTNPNAVELVRPLLTPLVKMAKRLHVAVIMIGHLNKDQMKSMMYRSSGSTGGWQGKARAAFLVARKTEDERVKRYVFPVKNNWAWPEPVQMEFEIINGKLYFQEECTVDASAVLNPVRGRPPEQSIKAKEIIADMFRDRDEIPAAEVEERCTRMGISIGTVKKVKREEGYGRAWGRKRRASDPDFWVWKKPANGGEV